MTDLNTLAAEWALFERAVVSVAAGDVQRSEMRLAFYAGASAVLALYNRVAATVSDDAAVAILEGLHQEAKAFAEAMRRQAALRPLEDFK
jgi:hypothetical protein